MKRAYESLLGEYLGHFPCVAILGSRQCGKTTLLRSLGADWRLFDLERQSDFQLAARDPDLFLTPQSPQSGGGRGATAALDLPRPPHGGGRRARRDRAVCRYRFQFARSPRLDLGDAGRKSRGHRDDSSVLRGDAGRFQLPAGGDSLHSTRMRCGGWRGIRKGTSATAGYCITC